MKIQDILEDIVPTTQTKKINHNWFKPDKSYEDRRNRLQSKKHNNNKLGAGYFSTVRADRNDPHMVRKHTHNFSNMDNYELFIGYIVDNELTSNPWFPRVYDITRYEDNSGELKKYQIEKLIPESQISAEEWEHLFKKTFSETWFKNERADYFINLAKLNPVNNDTLIIKFNLGIINAYRTNNYDELIDENLIAALTAVKEFCKEYGASNDIGQGNIMFRRSKYGIQGVLSDPVA